MITEKNKVIEFEYTMKNKAGEVLDSSELSGTMFYLHGYSNIIPGLEKAMAGKSVGQELQVTLEPEEAYGPLDEDAPVAVPLTELSHIPNLELDMYLQMEVDGEIQMARVTEIDENDAVLDPNHPLAGETLAFDVKIVDIREATEEEIEQGYVYDEHEHAGDHDCGCGCGH